MATEAPWGTLLTGLHAESHCVLPLGKVLASLLRGGAMAGCSVGDGARLGPTEAVRTGYPALPGTRFAGGPILRLLPHPQEGCQACEWEGAFTEGLPSSSPLPFSAVNPSG